MLQWHFRRYAEALTCVYSGSRRYAPCTRGSRGNFVRDLCERHTMVRRATMTMLIAYPSQWCITMSAVVLIGKQFLNNNKKGSDPSPASTGPRDRWGLTYIGSSFSELLMITSPWPSNTSCSSKDRMFFWTRHFSFFRNLVSGRLTVTFGLDTDVFTEGVGGLTDVLTSIFRPESSLAC